MYKSLLLVAYGALLCLAYTRHWTVMASAEPHLEFKLLRASGPNMRAEIVDVAGQVAKEAAAKDSASFHSVVEAIRQELKSRYNLSWYSFSGETIPLANDNSDILDFFIGGEAVRLMTLKRASD